MSLLLLLVVLLLWSTRGGNQLNAVVTDGFLVAVTVRCWNQYLTLDREVD